MVARCSGQDQVAVAELVPEVAARRAPRRRSASSSSRPATASSISRCEASGSCQPVSRPSTARTPRSGVIDELGPALAGARRRPSLVGDGLERPHDGRADGDHAAAPAAGGVDEPGRRSAARGSARGTAARRASSDDTPVCSMSGATRTPRGDEPRDQLGRERAPGARHLGAAGLGRRRRVW